VIHLVTLNPALDLFLDLERPLSGKIGKVNHFELEPGGKALNIARFLRKAKVPFVVWLGTGGGQDPTHVLYRSLLAREKIKVRFLSSVVPIRFNVVLVEKKSSSKFNHPGFETNYTGFYKLLKAVKKVDHLVLTGRLPQGDNEALYTSWVDLFSRKGARVSIDTSGKPLGLALKAHPWFFKVNRFELSEGLAQKFKDLNEVLPFVKKHWVRTGFKQGVVTDGAKGALGWAYPEAYWLSGPTAPQDSVVGAGDAFLAGYLFGLAKKKSFKETLLWAGAFGATVAQSGIHGFSMERAKKNIEKMKAKKVL